MSDAQRRAVTIRLKKEVYDKLAKLAVKERRSLANCVEMLLLKGMDSVQKN